MNLTKLAIRNSQFVIIILLILILLGIRSFQSMPRSEDPQADFPKYIITAILPGASPEDMEELIVDPLEEAIDRVSDVTLVYTSISEGFANLSIDGSFEVDSKDLYDEVTREVNSARQTLPDGLSYFKLEQIKPEDRVNIVLLAIASEIASYSTLNDIAEDIKKEIDVIDGTNAVEIEAYPKKEIRVTLDYGRMALMNINLGQVVQSLQSNNVNIPGGDISSGMLNYTINSTGGYDNIEEIKQTVITAGQGRVVYLKDIANVEIVHEDQLWQAEYLGEKAVYVSTKLKRGYNIIAVDKKIQEVIQKYQEKVPPNISVNVAFEQAPAVSKRINEFFINLLQGIALVGLVIFLVLGWRASIIIITLVPISVILSLAILNASGFALQQISVAALVLALGLLVDNGIVVVENITRFVKLGFSPNEASIKGTSEVGVAIFASTVTTLLSFFPLTQLGDNPGLFLASLPMTVIYTLVISLILSLTFSPIIARWIMPKKELNPSLSDKFFKWFNNKIYEPLLRKALRWGWLMLIVVIAITGFSISLFPKIGVSFFPTADKPLLLIDVNTPIGSSLEATEKATNFVEQLIDTMDIVADYTTNVGNGNPQVYYNRIPVRFNKSHGSIMINLKEYETQSFYQTIVDLRKAFALYPGAEITVEELKNGAPLAAPIEILIEGEELATLRTIANQLEDILLNTDGVINIKNPIRRNQAQININLDKEKAGLLGVSELQFDQTIRASLNGLQIDNVILDDQETYALNIRMPYNESPSLDDFDKIYIANAFGGQIPLTHIAKIELVGGPAAFSHYDLNRTVAVTASLTNLEETIPKTTEILEALDEITFPEGYSYHVMGEFKEQEKTFGSLGIILMLAQVAIFAVLVLQFRSILQPLIVFAAIPLAISGSFFALYLTGWSFSFFAFVGLISLIGIVVNNSIILVDYINQLRREGEELTEAIFKASTRRFKPILLTTITTILGLLPLTLQATNQWSPLCWTIIGGMISSSLLTLFIVPILYSSPVRWWNNIKRIFQVS